MSRWTPHPIHLNPAAGSEKTGEGPPTRSLSGNATRDDAPHHVRIQTHVSREVPQTWVSMCPAQVYEIPEDQLENGSAEVDVHVTASYCVQCGAITAEAACRYIGHLNLFHCGAYFRVSASPPQTQRGIYEILSCSCLKLPGGVIREKPFGASAPELRRNT